MREFTWSILLPLQLIACTLHAQTSRTTILQPGLHTERVLSAGQSHRYEIALEKDQYLRLIVDQRGIDVIVRTYSHDGEPLDEFDSPNGAIGPEVATIVANVSGRYRLEIVPLGLSRQLQPGRYEVRIDQIRKATEQELNASWRLEWLKARGLALLAETARDLDQLRRPAARAKLQIQTAELLWKTDENVARRLIERARDGIQEYIREMANSENAQRCSHETTSLRSQLVESLAPRDAEMALEFLRSTRALPGSEATVDGSFGDCELDLQLTVANRIAQKDPRRAFEIAENVLKEGSSHTLTETLRQIRMADPELASRLSRGIVAKLAGVNWLPNPEIVNLAVALIEMARPTRNPITGSLAGKANLSLMSEGDYRGFLEKMISEALSYSVQPSGAYSMEKHSADSLVRALKSTMLEVQRLAPERVSQIEEKWLELNGRRDSTENHHTAAQNSTIEEALALVNWAPPSLRDGLYQQVAHRAAEAGDIPRARNILVANIANPQVLLRATRQLDRRAVRDAVSIGHLDEALRGIASFQPDRERENLMGEVAERVGPGAKSAAVAQFLVQIRNMLNPGPRAKSDRHMSTLLTIVRNLARYDPARAFGIVEPLIDQFDELSAAAFVLNEFDDVYFEEGELLVDGGTIGNLATEIFSALSSLALWDFDRAKATADRIRMPDIRIRARLAIAAEAIQQNNLVIHGH